MEVLEELACCCCCPSACTWPGDTVITAGRWELGLLIGSAALVLPLRTQLPWYSHLLWPPLALLCAEGLDQLLAAGTPRWVGRCWQGLGLALSLAGLTTLVIPAPQLPGVSLLLAGLELSARRQASDIPNPGAEDWRPRDRLGIGGPLEQPSVAVGLNESWIHGPWQPGEGPAC